MLFDVTSWIVRIFDRNCCHFGDRGSLRPIWKRVRRSCSLLRSIWSCRSTRRRCRAARHHWRSAIAWLRVRWAKAGASLEPSFDRIVNWFCCLAYWCWVENLHETEALLLRRFIGVWARFNSAYLADNIKFQSICE